MKKIYLACPYSHSSKAVRMQRVIAVDEKAAELMEQGNLVFSPLSHSHPISMHTDIEPCDHDFWLRQDLWILKVCDELHILCLEGWSESRGVGVETEEALKLELPIFYHYYIKGRRV